MKTQMRHLLATALFGLSLLSNAQEYPSKPIRLVIPYPPGGLDVTARLLIPTIEKDMGQPWIIDYRPGATGFIGQTYVARQPPDGYTFLLTLANTWIVAPATRKISPFDPVNDFTPISLIFESLSILVANNSFPPNNMRELVEWTKRNPDKAAWATSGIGSSYHINGEIAKKLGNFDVLHTPFQGFGPMIPAILNGQVQMGMFTYGAIAALVNSGKMKIVGITSSTAPFKEVVLPGVQSFSDIAPGMQYMPDWTAIAGPPGLPAPVVRRAHGAIGKALSQSDLVERFDRDKMRIVHSSPEDLAARVRIDFSRVQRAVKETGLPLQD